MAIVTIAREFGAGGSEVAALLARDLEAPVVDRSLIAEVARRAALPAAEVAGEDELGHTLFDRLLRSFVPVAEVAAGWTADPADLLDHHAVIASCTRAALQEAGRSGNAVIVGRGAAVELRDTPGACHVFLWAPVADRVRTIRERLGCDEVTASREIHLVDARRAAYVREVYRVDWCDRTLYDMVLNTARLGIAGTAAAILATVRDHRRLERRWTVLPGRST